MEHRRRVSCVPISMEWIEAMEMQSMNTRNGANDKQQKRTAEEEANAMSKMK